MSEPSVEEIVERCEIYEYSLPRDEQRALIASWRERGKAIEQMRAYQAQLEEALKGLVDRLDEIAFKFDQMQQRLDRIELKLELADLCAALKDEPLD